MSNTKLLGVFLSWREQADYVSKIFTGIRRVRRLVTTECLLTLYCSLIYPYLSYCNIVLGEYFSYYSSK